MPLSLEENIRQQRMEESKKILTYLESCLFGNDWDWTKFYKASWITINTNVQKSISISSALEELEKSLKSLTTKRKNKCILIYCYEYYTNKGEHLHCHCLLFKPITDSRFGKRDMINHFQKKKIKKYVLNASAVQVEYTKKIGLSMRRQKQVLPYVLGKKKPKDKMENVEKDKKFRSDWNIPDYYLVGDREKHPMLFRFLNHEIEKYYHSTTAKTAQAPIA